MKVRLSKCSLSEEEVEVVSDVLRSGFLGMGPVTARFEEELAGFFGGGVTVTCANSGTAALHLAVQACGIGPGDEVLVPSLTFVASFQAVSATGAVPVSCDVNSETGLLDLDDAERRITKRTRAVMPVHYASRPVDMDAVLDFATRHGLRLIEDAAHAFGCSWNGRMIGSFGDIACFSFDGIKNITCGEGGAVVTADDEITSRVRDARLLGVIKDSERRYHGERSWDFQVEKQGWRYHMSDIMAAIGRVQLRRFPGWHRPRRQSLHRLYCELITKNSCPQAIPLVPHSDSIVPHIFPVRILNGRRDTVKEHLASKEIETGVHYKPNHLLKYFEQGGACCPGAEKLHEELLTLPLHPELKEEEVRYVCSILAEVTA